MTHYRTLIGGVGVIAGVLIIAFFALRSPAPQTTGFENMDGIADPQTQEIPQNGEVGGVVEAPMESGTASVEGNGVVTSTQSTPVAAVPVNTAPVSTPTPAPQPTPAPKPTGYTLAQISTHNNDASCWTAIRTGVYDLTSFISQHPGGERNILKICGKDGTAAFENQHDGQSRPESTLAKYYIGAYLK